MSRVDFHQIKACVHGTLRRVSECLDQNLDLIDGQFFRYRMELVIEHGPRNRRSCFHRRSQEPLAAAVFDLDSRFRTMVLDAVRQPSQAGDVLMAADSDLTVAGLAGNVVNIGVLHNYQTGAAVGQMGVVIHQSLGHRPILVAESRRLRRLYQTVLHSQGSDLPRFKQLWKHFLHCNSLLFFLFYRF